MSKSVQLTDPQLVFREPDVARLHASDDYYEIEVSFRGTAGSVGRRDFATHWIHWYPAKMFHRIPSVFLETVTLPSEATILDPFCGSGTVLLEANVRGHHAVGVDVNPLARLISQVKTTPIDPGDLTSRLAVLLQQALRSRALPGPQPTLDYWISAPVRVGIHRLSNAISQIVDVDCRAFFVVDSHKHRSSSFTGRPRNPPSCSSPRGTGRGGRNSLPESLTEGQVKYHIKCLRCLCHCCDSEHQANVRVRWIAENPGAFSSF